jgi:hypothetical protein
VSTTAEAKQHSHLTVPVEFVAPDSKTPVALIKVEGQGQDEHQRQTEQHEIVVHNARDRDFDLDNSGFTLLSEKTAVQDFYNSAEVAQIYYPEMEALVKRVTGADNVIVFDHTIRVEDEAKRQAAKVRGPVTGMHNDFTRRSAPARVRDLLPAAEAEARLQKRYGSLNVWRPIQQHGVVENKPLAICEWDSIEDSDLVAAERHYPDGRVGGIYYLTYNPGQRWYYFPNMTRQEIILLKCFDSLEQGSARWTAHGSFDIPGRDKNAKPRESIEIRTLYFFD